MKLCLHSSSLFATHFACFIFVVFLLNDTDCQLSYHLLVVLPGGLVLLGFIDIILAGLVFIILGKLFFHSQVYFSIPS